MKKMTWIVRKRISSNEKHPKKRHRDEFLLTVEQKRTLWRAKNAFKATASFSRAWPSFFMAFITRSKRSFWYETYSFMAWTSAVLASFFVIVHFFLSPSSNPFVLSGGGGGGYRVVRWAFQVHTSPPRMLALSTVLNRPALQNLSNETCMCSMRTWSYKPCVPMFPCNRTAFDSIPLCKINSRFVDVSHRISRLSAISLTDCFHSSQKGKPLPQNCSSHHPCHLLCTCRYG